jgi:ribosomal protein S18 acetylase RimI-like enzyme
MPMTSDLPSGYSTAPLQPGEPFFADAVGLYVATWPADGDAADISNFFTRYAALPDYHGLIALHEGALAGFGFGALSTLGQWWHDCLAAQIGGAQHPALQDVWALVDLAIAPEHRGKGVGGALLETLLAGQPLPRALLSTEVSNAGARRLYERHGWSYLHPGFAFNPGDPLFVVMRKELAQAAG